MQEVAHVIQEYEVRVERYALVFLQSLKSKFPLDLSVPLCGILALPWPVGRITALQTYILAYDMKRDKKYDINIIAHKSNPPHKKDHKAASTPKY